MYRKKKLYINLHTKCGFRYPLASWNFIEKGINCIYQMLQLVSCVQLFATPWTAARQASLSSPTLGVCSNSCPSSQWCHPIISSSVIPFSSCPQSFPASGSFPVSQFFISGGQSLVVSASALVLSIHIQDWFPLGMTSLILKSKGLSRVFSNTTVQKYQSLVLSFHYCPILTSIHDYWKNYRGKKKKTRWTLVSKVMSLLFNMLFRLVTAFLPRSKFLLTSWLGHD